MSTLEDIKAELTERETNSARSQQRETGGSQLYGCRAESLLRLSGHAVTDPRMSWQALVGKAIHAASEEAAGPGVMVEYRAEYRGVKATVDRYNKATHVLTDLKTKDDATAIAKVAKDGPPDRQRAQVHLGAAALIEDGHPVETVELLYLPRAGNLDEAWLWSEPFDRAVADEAAEWAHLEHARAGEHAEEIRDGDLSALDGLRDEPLMFCRSYCPFVSACRGPQPPEPELDEVAAQAAAEHLAADALEKEGQARKATVRPFLLGLRGNAGEFKILTSQPRQIEHDVEDIEALHQLWEFVNGDQPLPTRLETTTSTPRLTVKRIKPGGRA